MILGMDFLSRFEFIIDFSRDEWFFAGDELIRHPFCNKRGQRLLQDFGVVAIRGREFEGIFGADGTDCCRESRRHIANGTQC